MPKNNQNVIDVNAISISRMGVYQSCPRKFKYQYIDKLDGTNIFFARSLWVGNLVHACLEELIKDNSLSNDEVFVSCLFDYLGEIRLGVLLDDPSFLSTIRTLGWIIWRSTLAYRRTIELESDFPQSGPIRNKDGTPPSNIETYPTTQSRAAVREAGIYPSMLELDNKSTQLNPTLGGIQFSWVLAEAYSMVGFWRKPKWLKPRGVEVPISTTEDNLIELPPLDKSTNRDTVYIRGYIDLLASNQDDDSIYLIDHKTSKKKPTQEEVLGHLQLNVYAWVMKQLYGIFPAALGIHHVRSGEYIMVEPSAQTIDYSIAHLRELYDASQVPIYPKREPYGYNSPCINKDFKTGSITGLCPFISKCWPTLVPGLNLPSWVQIEAER